MTHHHAPEPVEGLPERLPPGEVILWQGRPDRRRLARQAFHVRPVTAYFALFVGWAVVSGLYDGDPLRMVVAETAFFLALTGVVLALLHGLAWASARSAVYTITNRRVVLRIGAALTLHVNLPFEKIREAAAKVEADGHGDVALVLRKGLKLGTVVLWPHVRPWSLLRPQPMLRAIPDADRAAAVLSEALRANALARVARQEMEAKETATAPASAPAPARPPAPAPVPVPAAARTAQARPARREPARAVG